MSVSSNEFRFISASRTHVGLVRARNEDSLLDRPDLGLWVVADGMGGHERGDYASQRIVASLNEMAPPMSGIASLIEVKSRLTAVNRELRDAATAAGAGATIGSTVVAVLIFDQSFCCLWAGDSRSYLMRDGQLRQISRDHNFVQSLVERGELSAHAAAFHPMLNVITNAVGAADELILEETRDRLHPNDVLLLCSDGLNRMVTDEEIGAVLNDSAVEEAADRLIKHALSRGAEDNVTVIVIRCVSGRDC